ncbi:hypothetical protein ACQP25_12530 [Microtetraspora malaysiensis]|uniref:hypothetical protein n=1 Tax=Microtetraspora malaysiensis TaxID=161358 RepID=UPI003D94EE72
MSTEPKTTIRVSFVTRDKIAKLAEQEDPEGWAEYLAEQELWLGGPSPTRRTAPEWEGLIIPSEDGSADHAG